jgi:oligopeptidase B
MRISTPAMPPEVREIDLRTGDSVQLKVLSPPNGHTESNYIVLRQFGISGDGQKIPMTIVHHRDVTPSAHSPVLLTGYGAYGMSLTPGFSASRRTLLTRGVIHVTAHVRGGMENGYQWYRSGRMANKDRSFDDLIGAAETLIRDGWTSAGNIVLHGGSAGGLLVGTTVMRRPELFKGVIADVPFVDVLETMLDADLPLTPPEWPEWGNPIESADAKRRLAHFSPTLMVEQRPYPCIVATAGLTDPRVTYWEPARWIHRLQSIAEGGPFLLYTELNAGHGGPSGRYAGLDDIARIYQAVMQLFALPKEAPYAL